MPKEDIFHAVKAIVATQRDYGRRDDRKYSRLKYLVQEWGVPKFRSVVEQYYGKAMQAFQVRAGNVTPYGCGACFWHSHEPCLFISQPAAHQELVSARAAVPWHRHVAGVVSLRSNATIAP